MAAAIKETFTPTAPDEIGTAEDALREVTRLFAEVDARRGRLLRRMGELQLDVRELRRRRARTYLEAFLPELKITYFERATDEPAPAPTLRGVLTLLYEALDDVLRIWWIKHFLRWWHGR